MHTNSFKLCSKYSRAVLSSDEISGLRVFLTKLNTSTAEININSICMKCTSITLNGKMFSSAGKRSKPVVVMALWEYGIPPTSLVDPHTPNVNIRPVITMQRLHIQWIPVMFLHMYPGFFHILIDTTWGNLLNCGAILFLNQLTTRALLYHSRTCIVAVLMVLSFMKMNTF